MRHVCTCVAATLVASTLLSDSGHAQEGRIHVSNWTVYADPSTGIQIDFPEGLFIPAGSSHRGRGQQFRTSDGRAEFSIYSPDGARRQTPRSYLRNNLKVPRRTLAYERVTRQFFAISAIDNGRIYYSRCNFAPNAAGPMHCIYLAYPKHEKKRWDAVVTRISLSLNRPNPRTLIPLSDRALLSQTPEFDCEFKTTSVDDAGAQPQPSPTGPQADPNTDGALRMKLDYERECYRHAEIILRDRLQQLQAAVGETIRAVDRGAQHAVRLPDRAVLASAEEFNCEFKPRSFDDGSGAGALRMKLDYERQCHKHGEMILRDRLRNLQASVRETIKAAKR
jgi:hypothetical protein